MNIKIDTYFLYKTRLFLLFTFHYSLFTFRFSLFIIHFSFFIIHFSLFVIQDSNNSSFSSWILMNVVSCENACQNMYNMTTIWISKWISKWTLISYIKQGCSSLFTFRYSLFTFHYSLFTFRFSLPYSFFIFCDSRFKQLKFFNTHCWLSTYKPDTPTPFVLSFLA